MHGMYGVLDRSQPCLPVRGKLSERLSCHSVLLAVNALLKCQVSVAFIFLILANQIYNRYDSLMILIQGLNDNNEIKYLRTNKELR